MAPIEEERLEECEALSAIFGNDFSNDSDGVTIRLEDHGLYGGKVMLRVSYSLDYPRGYKVPQVEIYSQGDRLEAERATIVQACQSALIPGEPCIFAAVTAGNEFLADLVEEERQFQHSLPQEAETLPLITEKNTRLARKIIYSHHIIADSKRAGLRELALAFQVSALVKIGWPGVIVLEGHESRVDAFVSYIQRWRWKKLIVRGEEFLSMEEGTNIDNLRALPCAFIEYGPHDMSILAQTCRDAGLEELFMRVFRKN
mmetsp:Transcript_4851/g.6865  ORF Transcript_4851/g.6865 Transcript_4851/m.6865 type:complete len:258 (+) Transcript_4851:5777-6550(+)